MLSICCVLPADRPPAYGMVLLETVQSGLALAELINLIRTLEDSVTHPFLISPWTGPFVLGCVAAMVVQFYFAYRIWVLSDKKLWWLCLTILFVSTSYFKYSSDTSSQRVSLWIVLRYHSNIRDYWGCLCEYLPRLCHLYSH